MARPINKEWMYENDRTGPLYTKGVEEFLEFANANNVDGFTTLPCPCNKCRNGARHKPLDVRNHLVRNGIDRIYCVWALHGEKPYTNSIHHPQVEDVHRENIEEEHIEVGGLGMENLVDTSYGIHEVPPEDDGRGQDGGVSNPSSSHPTSSQPTSSRSKGPKGKMKVTIEADGSVVGEYSKVWSSRTGDFVRSYIPISYNDIRTVPKNFKDDVWNALMVEFELDVPADKARPLAEKAWAQKFRSHKNALRGLLRNGDPTQVEPIGVDPNIWKKFVENERDPKKKEQIVTNSNNRKKLDYSHCLGRRSYAQKQYLMEQENPGKQVRRVDKWLAGHERSDGTVLESAKSKYDEVKAVGNRRKCESLTDEGCSDMCEDLDTDELAEVFGKETKGGVRGVGSHVSKKQLIQLGVAKSKIEQKSKANEENSAFKEEIISRLNNFENMMISFFSKASNVNTPPLVSTPPSDLGSNSVDRPTHLSQNLNHVFTTMNVQNSPNSIPTTTDNPPVILLDKFRKELAKGHVVTDGAHANTCHFKQVGLGEKKVYIEEVFDPNARLWDPPQGGHETFAGFVQGGYVIWLESWLKHV